MPTLPIVPGTSILERAPAIAVWDADPAWIRVYEWRSGAPPRRLLAVPRLYADQLGLDDPRVSMAPGGRFVAVSETDASRGPGQDRIRVFAADRGLVWTSGENFPPGLTTRWSPDGSRLAIDARGRWIVLDLTKAGIVTDTVIDTMRTPEQSGIPREPWQLIDFSEDGQTLIGAEWTGSEPEFRVAIEARVRDGSLQPIDGLPTAPGRRLAFPPPFDNVPIEQSIDPLTGRIAAHVGLWTGGRLRLFRFPGTGSGADVAWYRGTIVALWDEGAFPGAVRHLSQFELQSNLESERRIFSLPQSRAIVRFAAITDGYVSLVVAPRAATRLSELVLVRLSDGAHSVVASSSEDATPEPWFFGGWMTTDPDWSKADTFEPNAAG